MQIGYSYDAGESKFTGKERDAESGLDMFGARYYGSSLSRFMTPDWGEDPYPVPYADFENPQTLNLYGYAGNNPLSRRDADGHLTCDPDTATWGPNGVTVTAGACHLDALDYLRLSYYAFQGLNQFQQQQAAQTRQNVFQDLKSLDSLAAALIGPPCNCDDENEKKDQSKKSSSNEEKPKRISNPKHHPNSASPEPTNVQELFDKSVADGRGVRWAKDADGTIHRFSAPSNGESHWNGSTSGSGGIRQEDIPIEIRRALQ
jgi:RHS repeat-associated protein